MSSEKYNIHRTWLLVSAALCLGGCRETAVIYEIRPLLKVPDRLDSCCLTFINDGRYHSSFSVPLREELAQGGAWTLSVVDGGHQSSEMEIRGYLRGAPISYQRHSLTFKENQITVAEMTVPSDMLNRKQHYDLVERYFDSPARVAAVPTMSRNDQGLIFRAGIVSRVKRLDQPSIANEVHRPEEPGLPLEIKVADLNGDCLLDVVALYPGVVYIYTQDTVGEFHLEEGPRVDLKRGAYVDIALARLSDLVDGQKIEDQHLDLALATTSGIHIFNGDGAGGFSPGGVVELEEITAVEIGLINNDLHPDIVAARRGRPNSVVYFTAQEGFTAKDIGEDAYSTGVVVGELFRPVESDDPYDSRQEFHEILFSNKDGSLTFYQNHAGQQLTQATTSFSDAEEVQGMLAQDLDGDGRVDLVLVESTQTRVFYNRGVGGFSAEVLKGSSDYTLTQVQIANIDPAYQRDLLLAGESGIIGWR